MFEFIMIIGFLFAATSQLLPSKPAERRPGTLGKTVPGRVESRCRPGRSETARRPRPGHPIRRSESLNSWSRAA